MEQAYKTSKRNFFIKILLPTFLTIILFLTVFFALFIPQFENTIMDRKREMIKELTNSAWSILDKWHNAEELGNTTKEKAQEMAISQIQSLRYGEESKDYFWITDYSPVMIMHPYRADLNKKDLSNFKDSRGKKLFLEMADTAKKSGDGFVNYMWQWKDDSTKIVPKLSYVKSFSPWQWIIGTGIYIEDVRHEIAQLEKKIINVSIGITLVISVLLFFIAYQNLSTERKRRHAEGELHESREKYRALVEASTEGLIMILEGGQIFYNKTLYNILGYTNDAPTLVLSEIFAELPSLKSIDLNTLHISNSYNNNLDQAETLIKKTDGSLLNVLINASPITFQNSSGVVLSVKDISVNKKIEAELDKSREKYLALTNQLSIGVFRASVKKEFRFVEANSAALNILKIKDQEMLLKTSLVDCFSDASEFESFYENLLKNSSAQNKIVTINRSDLKSVVSLSAILVKDSDDNSVYLEGIIEDVSEQNRSNKIRDGLIYELQTAFLFLNNPVESFVKSLPTCKINSSVTNAINIMADEKSDCLLIEDEAETQIGFLSESDLRRRVLIRNDNLDKPVYEFMSSPLISVSANASIFDALSKLNDNDVQHLLVRNSGGKITGVIYSKDLQKSFHSSYLFFIQKIKSAVSVSELSTYHSQLMILVKGLIERHAHIDDITKIITAISDSIFSSVIQLAIKKLGNPPANFSFVVLGSAGRGEQTLATDQDNAIIFEDVDKEKEITTRNYFLKLGEIVSADLNQIGYTFCKGEIMARNTKWCQPLSVWKNYFTEWVTTASPQDLLDIKIFFDFRIAYGDATLTHRLQNHIADITSGYNPFFVYLSESISQFQMPESAVKLKSPLDIKMVLLPIVDCIRLYILKKNGIETNTIERLEQLYSKGVFSKSAYKNILQVYNFLMQKRLEHQSAQFAKNQRIDNQINPLEFSDLDIVLFKKSLSIIEEMQNKLKLEFKGTMTT